MMSFRCNHEKEMIIPRGVRDFGFLLPGCVFPCATTSVLCHLLEAWPEEHMQLPTALLVAKQQPLANDAASRWSTHKPVMLTAAC